MPGTRRRASLKDVAREAGVSYQTVSRVINDGGRVSTATRDRVLAVIAELGYRRNDAARALVTSRSHTIGVIADASPKYGPVSTLAAVESAARDAGYTALVTTTSHPSPQEVAAIFRAFVERGVEGVVVIAPRVSLSHVTQEVTAGLPVVLLSPGETSHEGITVFYEDQELGARLATRHLVELGHREVAHLAGSQDWLDGQVRLRGWQAELRAHALPAPAVQYGDWTGESAYRIGRRMVAAGLPTSVFVASDLMALGFLRALYEAGVRVPQDVSVVGFDDNEFAAQVFPPLTTVRQSFATVGSRCMEILLGLIEGQDVDTSPAEPSLVVRASAARPAR
ncbi:MULTISPECIES: LacI family DNA-binding transcriptional regulator [unclassified Cellulomonas]|uniref:LacI family DNA-binding transcriptional regulator n=1 Tax=unclassified Cellulomonas TaxID=2620175 RepID=UPI0019A3E0DF|nr:MULTISPECIES: LacI family DNA-binding transcriptional regulator [unclassified Cellulomonas]MBD3778179.1 LacI family DNA-binding transcriptional regulator [Micrococcales bacterium]QZN86232.1 LacI family DNA-binding transcriptional regulator [Cellulomonas sp. C5510]WHP18922.1 LacI family DNA-binding transcriptional regulator [Cellulomonas sp. ES6]